MSFSEGTLWELIISATEQALRKGALLPILTDYEFIEDSGVRFFVRILSSLARKDEERRKRDADSSAKKVNPFLPHDRDLFVSDISDTHVAVLNKFNVVDHHLLIITREFEHQEMLLTLKDFEALCLCMAEYEGFGFYNGGEAAGASQPHKHLQLVPLPLAPEGPPVPIEPLLEGAGIGADAPGLSARLPFMHAFAALQRPLFTDPAAAARKVFDTYTALLRRVGMKAPAPGTAVRQSGPYCLLLTRDWMLIVPRSREFYDGISVNSLGYAGALLVRNAGQLEMVRKAGPMVALKSVALAGQ